MSEVMFAMAIMGGAASAASALVGLWMGRKLGHIEAVGAMRYPDSKCFADAKAVVNSTLRPWGVKEIP